MHSSPNYRGFPKVNFVDHIYILKGYIYRPSQNGWLHRMIAQ